MGRIGVDTGGTFTDFVWRDEDGRLRIHKQLSTPEDPSRAIITGSEVIALGVEIEMVHGSTVATNALLERRGARTALVATAGFGDILAIGRQNRPDLYALVPHKVPPLVPDQYRFEIAERITADGSVQLALDDEDVARLADELIAAGVESVAVSLLFSFLWPEHEQRIGAAIAVRSTAQRPVHISLSSDILPEFREYERVSTTVINAYVAPVMSRYLARLTELLGGRRLTVMQSNGGVISPSAAGREAARTLLSGPAGGVVGAHYIARLAGFEDLITFDMGGTSTDVALCPGHLPQTTEGTVAGLPLHLPIIDIHTVGAGGGSLAHVDRGGALHVGPQSAGADPGPACYGKANGQWRAIIQGRPLTYRATTTDANLILGRLDAGNFLGGSMKLDERAAEEQLRLLATDLGVESADAAAWHVLQVANATMERAIRRISVERGHDPRRFTLVAFGGAGPLHACELAQQMQIPRVLVPAVAGVLSALGMLAATPSHDYARTVMQSLGPGKETIDWLNDAFDQLALKAEADMLSEGYSAADLLLERALDMRYRGQSYELTVPYVGRDMAQVFHEAHEKRYGYQRPSTSVEIVTVRLKVSARVRPLPLERAAVKEAVTRPRPYGHKKVWFNDRFWQTSLYQRDELRPSRIIRGPAIIFQYDSTIVVPPAWEGTLDPYGNLLLAHEEI